MKIRLTTSLTWIIGLIMSSLSAYSQQIIRSPYLQMLGEKSVQIRYRTNQAIFSEVQVSSNGKTFNRFKKSNQVNLEIEEYYQNINHEVKFCDAFQPHVVFYPKDFSATIVLWSDFQTRAKDDIKKIPLIAKFKKPLGKLIRKLRMEGIVGINRIENYDFYRENGLYYAMKERKAYNSSCNNDNYLQNIFAFIQSYGFNDTDFLNQLKTNPNFPASSHYLIDKLIENELISDSFCDKHIDIPFVNLKRKDLLD